MFSIGFLEVEIW